MGTQRRRWPRELKLEILARVQADQKVATVAREYDVSPVQIYEWQRRVSAYGDVAFTSEESPEILKTRLAELERKVGQLTMENDLLKKAHRASMQQGSRKGQGGGRL